MEHKVKVTIAGKNYVLTTDETERYTRLLAGRLDKDLSQSMEANTSLGLVDAAVLTALDYLDRCGKAGEDADNLRSQLSHYIDEAARATSKLESTEKKYQEAVSSAEQAQKLAVAQAVAEKEKQLADLRGRLEKANQRVAELENQIGFLNLKDRLEHGKKP